MCLRLEPTVSGAMRGSCAAVLVLLAACAGAACAGPIPRCCAAGSALVLDALRGDVLTRAEAAAACREVPEPEPLLWRPLVFLAPDHFMRRGELPQDWSEANDALPLCDNLRVVFELTEPYALNASNGYLMLASTDRSLPLARYCCDLGVALLCLEDEEHPFPKCCAKGHVYDGAGCVEDPPRAATAQRELLALAVEALLAADPETWREPLLGVGWPACTEGTQYSVRGVLADSRLEANSSVRLADGALLAGDAWCAEAVAGAEGARVLSCRSGEAGTARSPRYKLYGCGLAMGAAFLAATLAAGCALPAAQHVLHWRCQTQCVASLMMADILLAGTQLAGDWLTPFMCRFLAVCMYFLFLAAIFWLNTMCFNIWWTFRDFRLTSLEPAQERWRLRVCVAYAVYAWGVPSWIAYCAAWLDKLPPPPEGPALLRPRFGVQRCWFYGDTEILVFFFGPVGVLLLVNLALLVSTARQLTCGLWRRDEDESTSERATLGRMCAKLVVVMGVTWGADVVSWAAGDPEYVRYGTDLLNALQGVLIFLAVGVQPAALSACCRRAHATCPWRHCASASVFILIVYSSAIYFL